jgi:hypothetical protein
VRGLSEHVFVVRDQELLNYWREHMTEYPSVKLRMDFRDPKIVGTFAYHCHLIEHQDGGMMGLIRVEPRTTAVKSKKLVAGKFSPKPQSRSAN